MFRGWTAVIKAIQKKKKERVNTNKKLKMTLESNRKHDLRGGDGQ